MLILLNHKVYFDQVLHAKLGQNIPCGSIASDRLMLTSSGIYTESIEDLNLLFKIGCDHRFIIDIETTQKVKLNRENTRYR